MRLTTKAKHEQHLRELKKAITEFLDFSENLTLLRPINDKVLEIAQAGDDIQRILQQRLTAGKLVVAIAESDAASFLDEVVDDDAVSDMESRLLSVSDEVDNEEILQFLTELTDKIERKYNHVLEKVHLYNALLNR